MDVMSAAIRALALRSAWTPVFALAAGVATSIGPCVAPRCVAIAGLALNRNGRDRAIAVGLFIAGLVAAYVSFALVAQVIWQALAHSIVVYALLAAGFMLSGVYALTKPSRVCAAPRREHGTSSAGAIFLLGALSAASVSPCCVPLILAVVSAAGSSDILISAMALACFALGHALPLAMITVAAGRFKSLLNHNAVLEEGARVVGGALMVALGGLYAIVA